MCGIAGILDYLGAPTIGDVEPMNAAQSHRGPDGSAVQSMGPLVLGHLRLSILDPTPAGDQPMSTPDGRYHVIHNGEIYNFLELGDQLTDLGWRFRTKTDTEVILAAYARWGPDCVTRFNGIWALALWDSERRELFLSRDRFGVKPLHIAESGGKLAFASEIKALLTLPWVRRDPNPWVVRDYLLDGAVDRTQSTFIDGVRRLSAAHNLLVSPTSKREWRYWQPSGLTSDARPERSASDGQAVEQFRALLIESVSLQLRSDVPIGTCLSGGLDSSTIVAVAHGLRRGSLSTPNVRHHERDNHPHLAFFAAFDDPGIDERRYAEAAASLAGNELRTTTPDADAFIGSIEDVVWHQDEPFGSTSVAAQYHVMRLAGQSGIKVLLDGQGSDELLAGYPAHASARWAGALRSPSGPRLLAQWLRRGPPVPVARLFWSTMTGGAPPPTRLRPSRAIRSWLVSPKGARNRVTRNRRSMNGTVLARTLWRLVDTGHLPGLLRYEDRNSMAFGLESRVPFLDHRLVEAALLLPDRLKVAHGERKVVLREAVAGLVPSIILERSDKIGFASPELRWLRATWPALSVLAVAPETERLGLLRAGSMRRAFDLGPNGALDPDVMWRLINLELWTRTVLRGDRHPMGGVVRAAVA